MTRTPADDWLHVLDPTAPLTAALARGGAYADLFAEDSEGAAVRVEGAAVVRAARERSRGLAVRILTADGKTRIATSTALDAAEAKTLAAELAGAMALAPGGGKPEVTVALPRAPHTFTSRPDAHPGQTPLARRITLAELADRVARGVSPEVREVSVTVRDGLRRTFVSGADGRIAAVEQPRALVAVEVIASNGAVTQSAFEAAGGAGGLELVDEALVEHTARLAAERAVRILRARPAPAGEMPVVIAAEAGGTFVHEAVGHSLEADAVLEGMSALGERVGETIARAFVSVVDDATLLGKNGSFPVDDEGVPAERTVLVDRGVLVGLLHDERSARLMGTRSSGKGRRESFRSRPIVRMSNTMILPGPDDPAEILRDTPSGLYVVRMGGGEVDTVTGQFVFEVNEAFLIEDGALGAPVRGATLAGDAAEVLASIDRVGRDLGFGIGTCGKDGQDVSIADAEPTIRVPSLVVGGA
ncbi:TldD/PmbA family protein [Myxococcota bacterium]|nr:TldD/PmbA family protein [Myxococcota bacterium]